MPSTGATFSFMGGSSLFRAGAARVGFTLTLNYSLENY